MSETLLQINRALQHKITAEIKQNGAIAFAQFMKMALYEPGLGYYSAGLNKIGVDGDFITAPELGQMFAQCHANVFSEILPQLNQPTLVELGAGTGQFCVDVLLAMDAQSCLPNQYMIVEVSADLKQVQQQKCQQLPKHLQTLISWSDQPPKNCFEGIIFANEVLDALPVEIFQVQDNQYQRLCVAFENDQWQEKWQAFPDHLQSQLDDLSLNLANGYRSEFIPNLNAWVASIGETMTKGVMMLVDYGYGRKTHYHPQRSTGTLVCQRRHQAHFDPYVDIGLQDITAYVDFTAVAEAMRMAEFDIKGFTNQADFLMSAGIDQLLDPDMPYESYYRLVTEMKQLVLPEEMGEKFKTIVGTKNLPISIRGYEHSRWNDL